MFTGDHILFDISPNITFWPSVKDSLTDYIISLDKVRSLNVATALPGHRNCGRITANERIDQLFVHHEKRLAELEQMIREEPGLNGYELAGKMRWKIRATNWADFPPAQKWRSSCPPRLSGQSRPRPSGNQKRPARLLHRYLTVLFTSVEYSDCQIPVVSGVYSCIRKQLLYRQK